MTAPQRRQPADNLDELSAILPGQVQVWLVQLDAGRLDESVRSGLAADLDDATLIRLDRFRRAEDRDRGLAAHAVLRRLLASALDVRPRDLVLGTHCRTCGSHEHGKPYLTGFGEIPPAQFNLSHSGQLIAVAIGGPELIVGVDVETRERRVDWTAIRRSIFSDAEWDATAQSADPSQARMDAWSRKEAAVKATGHGLATPLRSVLISGLRPGGSDRMPNWEAAPEGLKGWDVADAGQVSAGYAAAVAVRDEAEPDARPPEPWIRTAALSDFQTPWTRGELPPL